MAGGEDQSNAPTVLDLANPEEPDEADLIDNPFILSDTLSVPPNSFVESTQSYRRKCPPPVYLTNEILLTPLPTRKDEIMKGLKRPQNGGLVCNDKEAMDRQKGVLVDVLK